MIAASAVPASEPFKPWFASMERSEVVVSTSWPAALMLAAQLRYASPSWAALVLLLAWA